MAVGVLGMVLEVGSGSGSLEKWLESAGKSGRRHMHSREQGSGLTVEGHLCTFFRPLLARLRQSMS